MEIGTVSSDVCTDGFSFSLLVVGWGERMTGRNFRRETASGRRKEMLREEVFQKATDGRPYSCFAEHYGQEYSECDAGKERAKQIAGRFFPGRRGVCFTQEGRIAGELRGLGIMRPFLVANIVNLAIRLSVALICAPRFGIAFVWLAVPVGWLANFLISYVALRRSWPTDKMASIS